MKEELAMTHRKREKTMRRIFAGSVLVVIALSLVDHTELVGSATAAQGGARSEVQRTKKRMDKFEEAVNSEKLTYPAKNTAGQSVASVGCSIGKHSQSGIDFKKNVRLVGMYIFNDGRAVQLSTDGTIISVPIVPYYVYKDGSRHELVMGPRGNNFADDAYLPWCEANNFGNGNPTKTLRLSFKVDGSGADKKKDAERLQEFLKNKVNGNGLASWRIGPEQNYSPDFVNLPYRTGGNIIGVYLYNLGNGFELLKGFKDKVTVKSPDLQAYLENEKGHEVYRKASGWTWTDDNSGEGRIAELDLNVGGELDSPDSVSIDPPKNIVLKISAPFDLATWANSEVWKKLGCQAETLVPKKTGEPKYELNAKCGTDTRSSLLILSLFEIRENIIPSPSDIAQLPPVIIII